MYLLSKYLKCSVWRLAVLYDVYIYIYISVGAKGLCKSQHMTHRLGNHRSLEIYKIFLRIRQSETSALGAPRTVK